MKHRDVMYHDEDIIDKELLAEDYVVVEGDEIEQIDEKRFKINRTKDQRYGFKTYKDGILLCCVIPSHRPGESQSALAYTNSTSTAYYENGAYW